jgi:hypothetical protein
MSLTDRSILLIGTYVKNPQGFHVKFVRDKKKKEKGEKEKERE